MSFFGNLLKIVAIGAFFIATGPFGLTVGSTLATALRIGGMVLGYLGAMVDRPTLALERQRYDMALDPGIPLPVVYGRAKLGGIVADWFVDSSTDDKVLYMAVALAHGSRDGLGIAAVEQIWLDNRKAITVTGDVRESPYITLVADYQVLLGTTVQNAGATVLTGLVARVPDKSFSQVTADYETGRVAITSSTSSTQKILTAAVHGYTTGDRVRISGHSGLIFSINKTWVITVTSTTEFTLNGGLITGNGTGGTVVKLVSSIPWSATTDTGKGVALLLCRFINTIVDQESGPTFHGPPAVSAIVQGNRIYDTRTLTWTGGADNPAMCIRDYLLAPIYGCGLDPMLIHEQSFKDAADYCDTLVKHVVSSPVTVTSSSVANPSIITATAHGFGTSGTFLVRIAGHSGSTPSINGDYTATYVSANSFSIPVNVTVGGTGGTVVKLVQIKRHTCNGVVDTARDTGPNLDELKSSCRGNLVWEQGQCKLTIRSELVASPTITLSPANIIGEWSFRNAGLEEKWNSATANYLEPANDRFKAQEVQWPIVGTTNSYLTSDGGFTNRLQLSLPFTNDQLMAQMIAQVTLNEARLGISCSVRCTEEALAASVGDKVYVTHPTPGWTLKQFWVTALDLMPDTTVVVSLQEYDSTAYNLGTMEDRRSFPATSLDSIFIVPKPGAVSTVYLSGGGMKITWGSASYGQIDFYEVQARLTSAGEDYVTIERVRENSVLQAVAPLARPGQLWDARVRVVNVAGWPSEWVDAAQLSIAVPGAVTPGVGQLTWTGFAPTCIPTHNPPDVTAVTDTPSGGDLCFSGGNWLHLIDWTVTGPDDTLYRADIDEAADAAGVTFVNVITGLTTASSSVTYDTGIAVNLGGSTSPTTYYRKYKVKIIRKSDGALIDSMTTTQATITGYSDNCA